MQNSLCCKQHAYLQSHTYVHALHYIDRGKHEHILKEHTCVSDSGFTPSVPPTMLIASMAVSTAGGDVTWTSCAWHWGSSLMQAFRDWARATSADASRMRVGMAPPEDTGLIFCVQAASKASKQQVWTHLPSPLAGAFPPCQACRLGCVALELLRLITHPNVYYQHQNKLSNVQNALAPCLTCVFAIYAIKLVASTR